MSDVKLKLEYVSVGCNRTPHSVDWAPCGLLAYGADKSVALAKESHDGGGPDHVIGMLRGHKDRVNCLRWMMWRSEHAQSDYGKATPLELVSGSVDNDVIVWRQISASSEEFASHQVLQKHSGPVTCLASIHLPPKSATAAKEEDAPSVTTLIASGSADSNLVLWERASVNGQFKELQKISFGRGFILGVDLFHLPALSCEPLLVCGGDDAKVHLFARQEGKFVRMMSLVGHEDWVRDVHCVLEDKSGDVLLASCAQDAYIRLWRVSKENACRGSSESAVSVSSVLTGEGGDIVEELKLTGNEFSVVDDEKVSHKYTVTLESVLIGHEDWTYSVRWHPYVPDPSPGHQPLSLLSTSMDKTMVLWQPDSSSGVWLEQVRVGEVGGNTLGLYGGVFGPHGDLILAHGYQGAFHLWKRASRSTPPTTSPGDTTNKHDQSQTPDDQHPSLSEMSPQQTDGIDQQSELWEPRPTISGHFGPVQDLVWEPSNGGFLISVSLDQTSRLHARWINDTEGVGPKSSHVTWQEVARPQIHGYDMQCIAMTTPLQYVSGADEKVMRVFEASRNFVGNLRRISQVQLAVTSEDLPLGATVPSLGLSNKAVFKTTERDSGAASEQSVAAKNAFGDQVPTFTSVDLDSPPVEEHLLQNTLWPETQKLYGHGYEVFCMASSPDGKYVTSACKASKPEHAVIRVWDSTSWRQVATLSHHMLTVTQLEFSHSGEYLLAVSRDRCWSLWKQSHDEVIFQLVAHIDKTSRTHARIIWSCSWSHDDVCFATASRDKKVFLWSQTAAIEGARDCGEGWRVASSSLECSSAVTAINFAPVSISNQRYILVVGLESGAISLYSCCLAITQIQAAVDTNIGSAHWILLLSFPPSLSHTSTVKRLRWRPAVNKLHLDNHSTNNGGHPLEGKDGDRTISSGEHHLELLLASCSTDHSVKLFQIHIPE